MFSPTTYSQLATHRLLILNTAIFVSYQLLCSFCRVDNRHHALLRLLQLRTPEASLIAPFTSTRWNIKMDQESLLRPAGASNMASTNYGSLGGASPSKDNNSLPKLRDTESSREEDAGSRSQLDDEHTRLRRELSARQISMIAIGGAIGTGLFLGMSLLASHCSSNASS